ncbi:hypothetical protein AAC387_Pa06g1439 [Persea americana]
MGQRRFDEYSNILYRIADRKGMTKSRTLNLASGFGGKINKKEVLREWEERKANYTDMIKQMMRMTWMSAPNGLNPGK